MFDTQDPQRKPVLLYIASRYPTKNNGGREHMIRQSLEQLSKRFSIHIAYHSTNAGGKIFETESCLFLRYPRKITILSNLAKFFTGFSTHIKCLQDALIYSENNHVKLKIYATKIQPEVLVYDMLRTTCLDLSEYTPKVKVLEIDDLLSKRYWRMLSNKTNKNISILGTQKNNFGISKAYSLVAPAIQNLLLKIESKALRKKELEAGTIFDIINFVSPLEAAEFQRILLQKHNGQSRSQIIATPPLFVEENIRQCQSLNDRVNILFFGNLSAPHNYATYQIIKEKIAHSITNPAVKFIIVGKIENIEKERVSLPANVELLGHVTDLGSIIKSSHILLAPIPFGSGVKLKIVEALRDGICVVTNTIGAEGIPIVDGVSAIIEDDPNNLLHRLNKLIAEPEQSKRIAMAGKKVFLENFDYLTKSQEYPDAILKKYSEF